MSMSYNNNKKAKRREAGTMSRAQREARQKLLMAKREKARAEAIVKWNLDNALKIQEPIKKVKKDNSHLVEMFKRIFRRKK